MIAISGVESENAGQARRSPHWILAYTFAAALAALLPAGSDVTTARAAPITLAVTGARVYPAPDALPLDDGVVLIDGDRIAAVGPSKSVTVPEGVETIDGRGLVVVAGYQNSHVHFTDARWENAAGQPAGQLTAQLEQMLTRYGFTTVVDTASDLQNTVALRRRIDTREVAGPRILTAGWALYPPDGVPFYVKETVPAEVVRLLRQPSTPDQAAAEVKRNLADGADVLKLFAGSWVKRGTALPMPAPIAAAAAEEAHRAGKLVFAHPSNLAGLEVSLQARVDVLAHTMDDGRGLTPAHFTRMREQDVALVPTLKLFDGRFVWDVLDQVRDYARLGGQILFGTDVGYIDDFDPTQEYELMQSAGLGWREILAALTVNPAARFREGDQRGRVAPGQAADLVVLGSDPARTARAFADVRCTIRNGRVIYRRS